MSSEISNNILNSIIYYDILSYPLTAFEVWKHLLAEKSFTLGEVIEELDSYKLKGRIEEFRGFYFLKGRRDLVGRRIQRDKNSIVKFAIAERVARWLRFVPFVRMVAVTGTLAMKNCEKNSDIDFFVVLEKGRIFTGRLLVTALVHLLGKRRYGKNIKNRICLNYFVATESLRIERQDLFAANEYSFIYPLFGLDVFEDFCETNLDWIKKFKPNWEIPYIEPARYCVEHSIFSSDLQKLSGVLINRLWGDRLESWLGQKQIARIRRNPLTKKEGAYIEATEENLIFLPVPQGVRIEEEWQRRIKS
ncbi:MAG TPA: hypothetical protein VK254_04085 [Candidatus Bathyarchaeia archaeon]|nr:hypothetical protein [Candidatus Bathyarchaeia archaeon]